MNFKKNQGEVDAQVTVAEQPKNHPFPTTEQCQLFDSLEVDYDHAEKPEEFLFSWCGKHFIQLHKLNGITATGATKVAAGKSMLCNLFMAAGLLGEMAAKDNPENVLRCNVKQCTSLYVDAEMGRSSTQTALIRVRQICAAYGCETPYRYKKRTKAISFEALSVDEMLMATRYYIGKYQPDVVYIDNMVFMLDNMDVNGANSALRIAEIDNLCKEFNTTIVLVAHGNKSADDANIAGTAGTMMMRLSAYILAIEEGDINSPGKFKRVFTQKARQGGFDGLPDLTFHFIPFRYKGVESVYPVVGQPFAEPDKEVIEYFKLMFAGVETMSYKSMTTYVVNDKQWTLRGAEKFIKDAIATGVIEKIGDKRRDPYKLCK